MLFALWSDQLKPSTCKENSVNLRKKLLQLLLRNIVRNGNRPAPSPSYEVIINFQDVVVEIEARSISWADRLGENTNHRLVVNTLVAVGLVVVALVISLPLIMDLVEGQFSFKTVRWSLEFGVSPQQ